MSVDQKLRLRNFDARHEKIETGAVVKNRKGFSGVERENVFCHQWTEKGQCSKGDQCSFRHESNDRAQKPTPKAATPSGPSMTRGRSTCRFHFKCTCTRSPCEYWHPPECQFYKNESGCKARDKCLFPHSKIEEQPSKKPKKSFQNGKSDDKSAVAFVKNSTTIGLCLARLRSEPSRLPKSVTYR